MDASILKRMKEVEKAVLDLDESVRGAAFLVMQDFILGEAGSEPGPTRKTATRRPAAKGTKEDAVPPKIDPPADFNGFMDMFESEKEADNAKTIAAHLYREYGIEPFSVDEVRKLADAGGVTVPDRVDKTLVSATVAKKKLFKKAGPGMLRPSIYGEAYFKKKYGVKKGTKKRKAAGEE